MLNDGGRGQRGQQPFLDGVRRGGTPSTPKSSMGGRREPSRSSEGRAPSHITLHASHHQREGYARPLGRLKSGGTPLSFDPLRTAPRPSPLAGEGIERLIGDTIQVGCTTSSELAPPPCCSVRRAQPTSPPATIPSGRACSFGWLAAMNYTVGRISERAVAKLLRAPAG